MIKKYYVGNNNTANTPTLYLLNIIDSDQTNIQRILYSTNFEI